jgi:hypothetical protein
MLIIGHNHLGGLENVEGKKIKVVFNLEASQEANRRGSTHFGREYAPDEKHLPVKKKREK